jgi:sarcosine oxidase, subunit delta
MMQINCPWCGVRDELEFVCGGTTQIKRPDAACGDQEWGEYLFLRENPQGLHRERWRHAFGCGQWFNVDRHTVTHEIVAVYGMQERPT